MGSDWAEALDSTWRAPELPGLDGDALLSGAALQNADLMLFDGHQDFHANRPSVVEVARQRVCSESSWIASDRKSRTTQFRESRPEDEHSPSNEVVDTMQPKAPLDQFFIGDDDDEAE